MRSFFFNKTNHELKEIKIIIAFITCFKPINCSKITKDIIKFQKKFLTIENYYNIFNKILSVDNFSLIGKNCRYSPTCSNYCILSLKKYGLIKDLIYQLKEYYLYRLLVVWGMIQFLKFITMLIKNLFIYFHLFLFKS